MLVETASVKALNVEQPGQVEVSGAEAMIRVCTAVTNPGSAVRARASTDRWVVVEDQGLVGGGQEPVVVLDLASSCPGPQPA